jgi:hypothetical protein
MKVGLIQPAVETHKELSTEPTRRNAVEIMFGSAEDHREAV